jgi:hypothetical protein
MIEALLIAPLLLLLAIGIFLIVWTALKMLVEGRQGQ